MTRFHLRGPALLFAPAHRKEIIPKAADRADMVILDLEDGAGQADRKTAYRHIAECRLDPDRVFVRVVGSHDRNHESDLEFVHTTEYRNVIVPKVTEPLPASSLLDDLNLVPIIETPAAACRIADIVRDDRVVALYWGADDFTIGLGGLSSRREGDEKHPGTYREPLRYLRAQTLIHASAAEKYAIDAVYQDFTNTAGLYDEALDSARSGFDAFPCIHPSQVSVVRRAFTPTDQQVRWARRVADTASATPGAFKLDGEMVDTPLIALAHRLLDRESLIDNNRNREDGEGVRR